MFESAKLHECMMGGLRATWHERSTIRHYHSALLECRMAPGHATMLTPWWANFVLFSNVCYVFSCFLKKNYFICDHETLS